MEARSGDRNKVKVERGKISVIGSATVLESARYHECEINVGSIVCSLTNRVVIFAFRASTFLNRKRQKLQLSIVRTAALKFREYASRAAVDRGDETWSALVRSLHGSTFLFARPRTFPAR